MNIKNTQLRNNHSVQSADYDTGDLLIEEVNDLETFESLKESWNILLQQCPDNDIFLTWEWLFLWWKHHGGNDKLRILLIKEKGELIGIAPFMQSEYRSGFLNVNVMENLCAIECDHSGIIYKSNGRKTVVTLLSYLTRLIKDEKIIVRMSQISENSNFAATMQELHREFSDSLLFRKRTISSCPYIILPETREKYFQSLSKRRRKELRRKLRWLQQDHVIELKEFDGDNDNLRDQLQVLFTFHENRWKAKIGYSKFTERNTRDFYFDVSKAFHRNKWLAFTFLNVDGEPASVFWGFKYNNALLRMTTTFSPEYSRYSVGQLQTIMTIEKAIQDGLSKYDFLKGADNYKYLWTSRAVDNIQFIIVKGGFWANLRVLLLDVTIKLRYMKERSFRENLSLLSKKIKVVLLRSQHNTE